jgi:large conductance mechanosensitive channel
VLIKYGSFLQTIFDFVIIAIVLFMCIKGINKLKKPAPVVAPPPPPPPRSEVLLEEIRDLLARRA